MLGRVGKDKSWEQPLVSLPGPHIQVTMKHSPKVSSIKQEAPGLLAKATEFFIYCQRRF
uniref:Uncharacterized protein n=1 Tax=Sciurus vulgaris TaxID=55149 RepID=A0A8D2CQ54_SCIVU